MYNYTEKYIRVKHKTYVPVELCQDCNGRMINTPLKSVTKPELSLGAETRATRTSESVKYSDDDDLTEVEYPVCKRCNKKVSFPDSKIKVNI